MLDLEPIKARLYAATGCAPDENGTWRAERDITDEIGPFEIRTNELQFDDPCFPVATVPGHDDDSGDVAFIAHAPATVAALIAEVEDLRATLADVHERMGFVRQAYIDGDRRIDWLGGPVHEAILYVADLTSQPDPASGARPS